MIKYDADADVYRISIDEMKGGVRNRREKTLHPGMSREVAERVESLLLDPDLPLRERLQKATEATEQKPGSVYAIKNEFLPGLIKIGMTCGAVRSRILNLSSSLPVDFELVECIYVKNPLMVEQALYSNFFKSRVNRNREFFRLSEEEIKEALRVAFEVNGVDLRAAIMTIGMR